MSILKTLLVDSKSAWVDYPGLPGFSVELSILGRQQIINLRKSCVVQKFDRKTHQKMEELDTEKFINKFTKATVNGWRGLKYKYLEELMPVDISSVNPEEEMPFTIDDAILLVSNSSDFDTWLNEAVFDLDNFRTERKGDPVGESEEVAQ